MATRLNTSLLRRLGTTLSYSFNQQAALHESAPNHGGLMPSQNKIIHVHEQKPSAVEKLVQKFAEHNKDSLKKDFDRLEELLHKPSDLKKYLEEDQQFDRLSSKHQILVNPGKAARKVAKRMWNSRSKKTY